MAKHRKKGCLSRRGGVMVGGRRAPTAMRGAMPRHWHMAAMQRCVMLLPKQCCARCVAAAAARLWRVGRACSPTPRQRLALLLLLLMVVPQRLTSSMANSQQQTFACANNTICVPAKVRARIPISLSPWQRPHLLASQYPAPWPPARGPSAGPQAGGAPS